jgi:hypothetical protein
MRNHPFLDVWQRILAGTPANEEEDAIIGEYGKIRELLRLVDLPNTPDHATDKHCVALATCRPPGLHIRVNVA